jgi:ribonuclease HII
MGIDEAGRGPLAGPVSIGVLCVPSTFDMKLLKGVRDSKKLSKDGRSKECGKINDRRNGK